MVFDVFPTADLFDPETEAWKLRGVTIGGGVSVGGSAQLSRTDGGGLWTCEQTGIEIYTPEQLLAASALDMQMDGGSVPIVVPCFNWPLRPVPAGVDWRVAIALIEDAALRATTLTVVLTVGSPLIGGEPFSITGPVHGKRLYRVHSQVSPPVTTGGVTTQTVRIRPPTREAITAGTALDFERPGCVMRLTNPDGWLSPLDAGHEQVAQPTWVEHFDRPAPVED